jgi:hypothetical protein
MDAPDHPHPSTRLLAGTRVAFRQARAQLTIVGAEPMYEVIIANSEGDFVNPELRGWVVARKVRPIASVKTGGWRMPRVTEETAMALILILPVVGLLIWLGIRRTQTTH